MTATALPADGPADPPSSRPHAGVLGGAVFAYRFDPDAGEQRVTLPVAAGVVTESSRLHWAFYADDEAAVSAPWASLAVCVDLVFDDGSRLAEGVAGLPAIDRYGFDVTPAAQFAARWSMPEQWSADTVALSHWAGRHVVAVELVLGDESLHGSGVRDARGFVEVRVAEEPATENSPAERVDTRRGSHAGPHFSRGNTLPLVAVPHGFAFLTPATDADSTLWPYRAHLHDEDAGRRLEAIQISHQPSPWIGDRTVLQFAPFHGSPSQRRVDRRLFIRPGSERAQPHRYVADLVDAGGAPQVSVEATATCRVALLRVRGSGRVGLILDQPHDHGRLTVRAEPGGRVHVEGWVAEGAEAWGNAPRMYFAGEVQGRGAAGGRLPGAEHPTVTGTVQGDGELELRVATSFLSVAQAHHTLRLEAPWADEFDAVRRAAREQWDEVCAAVQVPDSGDRRRALADDELRAQVAGNLYRLHLYPNSAAENTGTAAAPEWRFADVFAAAGAHGDEATGAPVAPGRLVVNNGFWDTYRTVWPLLNLLDAPLSGALLDGQLEHARRGGWMARWSAPGYVDSMVGTSSDQIFADAHAWGVPGLDAAEAFATGWRNACEQSVDRRTGRAGVGFARFSGFVPNDVHEGFSWAIEAAIADAALGRFAARLAVEAVDAADAARYRAFARYFANRALGYRQLFDRETGFFRGRDRDGMLPAEPFDARVWGGDYVETNAWGMSVSAVHDGAGLASAYGGPAGLRAHLEALFAEPETAEEAYRGTYGHVTHEQREARGQRSGMCALSNQPAHHIPYMHVHGDQPWRAGATVHALARRLFAGSHIGQGYPGDEDNGEMSAWWLWALIGLYPLELASGELLVGDPLVDDVTLARAGGRLRVRSRRRGADPHARVGVAVNGVPLERAAVPLAMLAGDVTIELDFADEPDGRLWADRASARRWAPDLARPELAIASGDVDPRPVFDDRSGANARVPLAASEWVGQDFGTPLRVTDLTLTGAARIEPGKLLVEHSDDGESWSAPALSHRETAPFDRTTPFQLAVPITARFWRVRATAEVLLRQVELFDLDE